MDIRVLWTAFAALFLAELGDKTQLAVLTLSASTRKPLSVAAGALAALALLTVLAAFVGEGVARLVPERALRRGAAALFVAIGLWMGWRA